MQGLRGYGRIWGVSLLVVVLGLSGCNGDRQSTATPQPTQTSDLQTFENVDLSDVDPQGKPTWKLKAQRALYSQTQKKGQLEKPSGQFFRQGEAIYGVSANRAEVQADGEVILLRGAVEVRDLRGGAVLRSQEAEWRPQAELLIMRQQLTGAWQDLQSTAQEARWQAKENLVTLTGQPVFTTSSKQNLKLKTDRLVWHIPDKRISGDRPTIAERFDPQNPQKITGTAQSQQIEGNLTQTTLSLKQQAKLTFTDPPLDLTSDLLRWNTQTNIVNSEAPVTIVDRKNQLSANSDRGEANLTQNTLLLTGKVNSTSQNPSARLTADQLLWNLKTQAIDAQGNVRYVRNTSPPLDVSGPRAVGNLKDESVVVSGGRSTTVVIPLNAP